MATTPIGQEISKYILPSLLKELRNNNYDFISQLRAAPLESITSDGISVQRLLANLTSLDINRTKAYTAADFKQLKVETLRKLTWNSFSTVPTEISEAEINKGVFGDVLKSEAMAEHIKKYKEYVRDFALHALAPESITDADCLTNKIVKVAKGNTSTPNMLVPENLIDVAKKYAEFNVSLSEVYVVLAPQHVADLLKDALRSFSNAMQNIYENSAKGLPTPYLGLNFFVNNAAVYYGANNKRKEIGTKVDVDKQASVIFYKPHTFYAVDKVETAYVPRSLDVMNNPSKDTFRMTGHFLAGSFTDNYSGIII